METTFDKSSGNNLADSNLSNLNYNNTKQQQRELAWQEKIKILRFGISDNTGNDWNPRLDSSNTRDFINVEIRNSRESVFYQKVLVYKHVRGKYVRSTNVEANKERINQLVTANTVWKNELANIPP